MKWTASERGARAAARGQPARGSAASRTREAGAAREQGGAVRWADPSGEERRLRARAQARGSERAEHGRVRMRAQLGRELGAAAPAGSGRVYLGWPEVPAHPGGTT